MSNRTPRACRATSCRRDSSRAAERVSPALDGELTGGAPVQHRAGMSISRGRKDWETTAVQNLMRYRPSGTYFARFKVGGRLVWKSLETSAFSVAKQRLAGHDARPSRNAGIGDSICERQDDCRRRGGGLSREGSGERLVETALEGLPRDDDRLYSPLMARVVRDGCAQGERARLRELARALSAAIRAYRRQQQHRNIACRV